MSARPARTVVVVTASMLLMTGLAACGDDPATTDTASGTSASPSLSAPSTSPSVAPSDSPSGEQASLPTVKGGFGQAPTVTVPDVDPPSDLVVKVLSEGKGPDVASGDLLVVDYLGARWDGGQTFDSSFDRGPIGFTIGAGAVIPGWDGGLVGVPVGSRVLLVAPPDQAYGDTSPGDPIQPGDTLVFVVDVVAAHSPDETAKGEPAPTEDDSLPYVSITPKEPEIVIPAGEPANRLIAIPVVIGDGPKVKSGQTVVVQYKGVLWRNGKVFDSTWSRDQLFATSIGTGSVVRGWDKGLVGQTVGSRVMLVIPPKDGYGSAGSGPIKGTDTMVFAVDILGAY